MKKHISIPRHPFTCILLLHFLLKTEGASAHVTAYVKRGGIERFGHHVDRLSVPAQEATQPFQSLAFCSAKPSKKDLLGTNAPTHPQSIRITPYGMDEIQAWNNAPIHSHHGMPDAVIPDYFKHHMREAIRNNHFEAVQALHETNPDILLGLDPFAAPYWMSVNVRSSKKMLPFLHALDPNILKTHAANGKNIATIAATDKNKIDNLAILYELDPCLLALSDAQNHTPATTAALCDNLEALEVLNKLNPQLLYERDASGNTVAGISIEMPRPGATLLTLHRYQPALFTLLDQDGRLPSTKAVLLKNRVALDAMNIIDPTLLLGADGHGDSPVTLAVKQNDMTTLSALYSYNAALFLEKDGNGYTAETMATALNRSEALAFLTQKFHKQPFFESDMWYCFAGLLTALPGLFLILHTLRCFATGPEVQHEVNVHDSDRDSQTIEAFKLLQQTVHPEPMGPEDTDRFLADLGLNRIKDWRNLGVASDMRLYHWHRYQDASFGTFHESRVDAIETKRLRNSKTITVMHLDEYPPLGSVVSRKTNLAITQSSNKTGLEYEMTFENKRLLPDSVFYMSSPVTGQSQVSEAFKQDAGFRYALGFSTVHHNALYNPLLFSHIPLRNGENLAGYNVIVRAYLYCFHHNDAHEQSLRLSAFIGGIKQGFLPPQGDFGVPYRLCEAGQAQYLFLTLLQGRLPGVMIDDTHLQGLKAVVPKAADLVQDCCYQAHTKEQDQTLEAFLAFTQEYQAQNPFLTRNAPYPELQKAFLQDIKTYERMSFN